ncbi:MAG: DNA repair protein RecN [Cetobacterium somerae]|jgi:DNA repair protein RecN (Recombination protein N)|uniref:DNA repair protein RecN n=1 Tax=Cetobacterium TaxID=180162 RepID=UPI00163B6516|nr:MULTISPECIES: DNA repair protein RecN [Cetobacterium]MBC2852926.1 DNA repair protein RecN [Cetobacterium sp. 2G large]WVJ01109.1 DNA repair protein RecN [Cetobacterium somerae]
MLKELKIENLAIIEKVDLEFKNGLIVLTGETGAGKSIILSGINLLIGEKASADMVRDGEEYLLAQGVFAVNEEQEAELKELGIEAEDNEVIVRRHIDKNGKGKAFVNNIRVPMSSLKEIMGTLVDIVGQHSHQMLLNKSNHLRLLDRFLGDDGIAIKKQLEVIYNEYSSLERRIQDVEKNKRETLEKKEFYEFQLQEIDKVNLKDGEDEKLEEEYKKLFHAGKIKEKLSLTENILKDGEKNALNIIYNSRKNLETISKYGKEFQENLERLERVYYDLQDCVDSIRDLNDDIEADDMRLEKVISRLDAINRLKSKYGDDISTILQYREKIDEKLQLLDENSFQVKKLEKDRDEAKTKYYTLAKKLSDIRKLKAKIIEENLQDELKGLNMGDANFKIEFEESTSMTLSGIDQVEFMISTNVGQGLKPLWKVASGGEVSRIMLAIKVIFSKVDNIPILIFDEIDTGVGGETVRKIANKLQEIGETTQVMSITHSPAIAAKATQQFYIEKKLLDNKTITQVKELDEDERVKEIARMLAGKNISEAVIEHAKELLGDA